MNEEYIEQKSWSNIQLFDECTAYEIKENQRRNLSSLVFNLQLIAGLIMCYQSNIKCIRTCNSDVSF